MSVSASELRIGIVGAGGFAAFAARAFLKVDGVKIVAVADTNEVSASTLADAYGACAYSTYELFLKDDKVDVVYIATPPALHYEQSKAALLAGKNVICEKPAALTVHEAEELVALARGNKRLYVVNLMQRYNPLYQLVRRVIDDNTLGDFTHGYFENYASDEALSPEHWFWDDSISGGIFIEHGVHFFDLFAGWLGQGELAYSARWKRPLVKGNVYDRVQAIVNYEKGPVSYYHGFDQPKILDRQEIKLQFERGDITLYGWVPVRIKVTGLFNHQNLGKLKQSFPGCSITTVETGRAGHKTPGSLESNKRSTSEAHSATGRFKNISYDYMVIVESGSDSDKMQIYEQLLKCFIKDQWDWILDNSVTRTIDGRNAVESLRIAELSTTLAKCY
jgi:predicted dehydrogenase